MDLPEIALVGAGAADLMTTELALAHDGFRELNPVMGSPAARVGVKTLATVAVIAGSRELRRRGHRRWAKGLCWGGAVVWAGAAAWNVREMQRAGR